MGTSRYESVEDYLAAQPKAVHSVLERVRATIRRALPGVTEGISYQMPVYKLGGVMVLYVAGYPRHWSIYPATGYVVAALEEELAGRVHSKATIRFPLESPVPAKLIARIAKLRAAEVAELAAAKASKRVKPRAPKKRAVGAPSRRTAAPRRP